MQLCILFRKVLGYVCRKLISLEVIFFPNAHIRETLCVTVAGSASAWSPESSRFVEQRATLSEGAEYIGCRKKGVKGVSLEIILLIALEVRANPVL